MTSERGVNYIGDTTVNIGLGEATRSTLDAIISADIPVSYRELNYALKERVSNSDQIDRYNHLKQNCDHDINLIHYNFREYYDLAPEARYTLTKDKYTIVQWIWEQSEIPPVFHPAFYHVDEIWTASRFAQHAFANVRPVPVHVIPYPVSATPTHTWSPAELGVIGDKKTFFFSFSALSVPERKNPFAVIEAFRRAFPKPTSQSPVLILKAHHLEHLPEEANRLRRQLADIPHVLIEESLSRQDMINLMHSIDCFVSLHRAEGFGLGMAEAMLLGKPVIATNYSGNTDFMNLNNSFPVRYTMTHPSQNIPIYDPKIMWAEPDIDHAAELMQLVMSDPDLVQERARLGQKTIQENYSPDVIGQQIKNRLAQIQPTIRHKVWTFPTPPPTYAPIDLETASAIPQDFDLIEMSDKLKKYYHTWEHRRIPETRNPLFGLPVIGFVLRLFSRVMRLGKMWADLKFILLALIAIQTELVKREDLSRPIQNAHDRLLQKLESDTSLLTRQRLDDKHQ